MSARLQRRAMAGAAVVLALLAAIAGSPARGSSSARGASLDAVALAREIEHEDDHVTARELGEWIRSDKPGLRVLDVRSDSEFAAYHIPSAQKTSLPEVASLAPVAGETLVLYSEGGAHAAQAWVLLRARGHERVYFLRGGLLDWMDDVMSPVIAAGDSSAYFAALSRYFGGVPRASSGAASATAPLPATASPASAVERVRRRGC